ncbi:hypothetical protein BH23BAC1_BH23BAC1_42160 [soil metagenome]
MRYKLMIISVVVISLALIAGAIIFALIQSA